MKNGLIIDEHGTQEWYQNDLLHREGGPAAIWADGSQFWYRNGKQHRLDGPAAIQADGTQRWYQNGLLHRLDGPAAIRADGTQRWYLNGRQVTERDHPFVIALKRNRLFAKWKRDELTEDDMTLVKLSM